MPANVVTSFQSSIISASVVPQLIHCNNVSMQFARLVSTDVSPKQYPELPRLPKSTQKKNLLKYTRMQFPWTMNVSGLRLKCMISPLYSANWLLFKYDFSCVFVVMLFVTFFCITFAPDTAGTCFSRTCFFHPATRLNCKFGALRDFFFC